MEKNNINWNADFVLQTVIDNAPDYIFWKDIDSIYRGCNQNSAILYGLKSPQKIVGKLDYDFNQAYAAEFIKEDKNIIKTGNSHISEYNVIHAGTGKLISLKAEKKPLKNKFGETIGILIFAIDISHNTKEEEQLKLSHAIAEERKLISKVIGEQENIYYSLGIFAHPPESVKS